LSFIRRSQWHRGLLTLVCIGLLASCNDKESLQPAIPTVTAPNVVGMTQAAATTTLKGAGLVLGTVTPLGSVTVPVGTVISQSVAPGVIVAPGSSVNIVVSSGPTTVPDVVGQTQAAAAAALAGAGLTLGAVTAASSTTVPAGTVISQTPAAAAAVVAGTSVNVTISVGLPASYAYAIDNTTISAFSINSAGQLAPLAGPPITVPGSGELFEAKIDPSGKFLYAMDIAAPDGGVYAFSITPGDGSLVALNGGLPYQTGSASQSLAFDATGAFIYVLSLTDNSIAAFSLDQSTGQLGAPTIYPIASTIADPKPSQMVSAGNHLYVAEYGANAVEVFTITAGTGALTQGVVGSPFATDVGPHSLAVDPSGAVLYTANVAMSDEGSISPFTINSSTGVLTPASVRPLLIPAFNRISIDPLSKFLFVTEPNALAVYPITLASAALGSAVAAPPFAAGSNPYSVGVDPADQFVYVADQGSNDMSEFTFDSSTGVLTEMGGSPIGAGSRPVYIAIH